MVEIENGTVVRYAEVPSAQRPFRRLGQMNMSFDHSLMSAKMSATAASLWAGGTTP